MHILIYLRICIVHLPCHAYGRQRTFQEQKIIRRILCKTTSRSIRKKCPTIEIGIILSFFFLFVFASLRKSFGSFGGCRWCTHTAAWTTVCSDSAYQSICVILVGALRWTRTRRKTWTSILFYNMRHSVKCFGYVNRVHSPRCWSLWISFDRFTRCTHRKEHSPNRCTRK